VKRWSHAQLLYKFPYKCNRTATDEIYSGCRCLWSASLYWVKPIEFLFNITVLYFVVVQVGVAIYEWNTFTATHIIVSVFCVSQIDTQDYKVLISLSSVVLFVAFEHPFYVPLYPFGDVTEQQKLLAFKYKPFCWAAHIFCTPVTADLIQSNKRWNCLRDCHKSMCSREMSILSFFASTQYGANDRFYITTFAFWGKKFVSNPLIEKYICSINNQLDAVFSFFLYFCYTLYMFRVPLHPSSGVF
jgi:hypothetical protein